MSERISVAYGDGIGPEIMEATLLIMRESNTNISIDPIDIGEKMYNNGWSSGISDQSWDIVRKNKILLKAPITTPQGSGYKSLNVTFRKALGLYANVRPVVSYHPFVKSLHEKMDLVIIRENEEDLYAGIEYQLSSNSTLAYKLLTREGSEKIIRYAFEYAKTNGRKKVTCMTKDNIMKITDGMFHRVFDEIAKEYPDLESEHYIVDIGSARLAAKPYMFDVIVMPNLYGDIASDITSEVSGSVGLAGSANIGKDYAMFEAIHGSAPRMVGRNTANPSGLLHGAIMMLNYMGKNDVAATIHNAWLKTIEDGLHTHDIYQEGRSKKALYTMDFAKAVCDNLGQTPVTLNKIDPASAKSTKADYNITIPTLNRRLVGVDIFLDQSEKVSEIADKIKDLSPEFNLQIISQKGIKMWPYKKEKHEVEEKPNDAMQCRFMAKIGTLLKQEDVVKLINQIHESGCQILSSQFLFDFNEENGFSKSQGE